MDVGRLCTSLSKGYMVSIYVNGTDKTSQISDWTIKSDGRGGFSLTCHYHSGKSWPSPLDECKVVPTREVKGQLLRKKTSSVATSFRAAAIYGEKYAVIQYAEGGKKYVYKLSDIEFVPATQMKCEPVFKYFHSVATARIDHVEPQERPIAENVLRQVDAIIASADTALNAYCTGQNAQHEPAGDLIFPFGINESQLHAVEQAFTSQISLIEGPPGTGKTQTILNIVANILLREKTWRWCPTTIRPLRMSVKSWASLVWTIWSRHWAAKTTVRRFLPIRGRARRRLLKLHLRWSTFRASCSSSRVS